MRGKALLLRTGRLPVYAGTLSHTFKKKLRCLFTGSCNHPLFFFFNSEAIYLITHLPSTVNVCYSEKVAFFPSLYVWPYHKLSCTIDPSITLRFQNRVVTSLSIYQTEAKTPQNIKSDRSLLSRISGRAADNELLILPLRRYFPESWSRISWPCFSECQV